MLQAVTDIEMSRLSELDATLAMQKSNVLLRAASARDETLARTMSTWRRRLYQQNRSRLSALCSMGVAYCLKARGDAECKTTMARQLKRWVVGHQSSRQAAMRMLAWRKAWDVAECKRIVKGQLRQWEAAMNSSLLADVLDKVTELESQLGETQDKLEEKTVQLEAAKQEYGSELAELADVRAELTSELAEARDELADASSGSAIILGEAQKRLVELESHLSEAERRAAEATEQMEVAQQHGLDLSRSRLEQQTRQAVVWIAAWWHAWNAAGCKQLMQRQLQQWAKHHRSRLWQRAAVRSILRLLQHNSTRTILHMLQVRLVLTGHSTASDSCGWCCSDGTTECSALLLELNSLCCGESDPS